MQRSKKVEHLPLNCSRMCSSLQHGPILSLSLAGIVSLVSLSLLSLERYSVVLRSAQPDSSQYRRARLAIAASWFYSLLWTLPPLLGWGRSAPSSLITSLIGSFSHSVKT